LLSNLSNVSTVSFLLSLLWCFSISSFFSASFSLHIYVPPYWVFWSSPSLLGFCWSSGLYPGWIFQLLHVLPHKLKMRSQYDN
jgi:hypothetical protein